MKSKTFFVLRAISAAVLAAALGFSCASTGNGTKTDAVTSASTVADSDGSILKEIEPVRDGKRTLVVFFTSGNASERVADDLAAVFGADVERIVEKKPRKVTFMSGGMAAMFGSTPKIETPKYDPADYGRVFVLTPVWGWTLSPPVKSWLKLQRGRLPEAAYGTISGDTEPEKIVAKMAKVSKRKPFAYAGFSKRDFSAENRAVYLEKIRDLAGLIPRESP
jgi:hypothetical protein